jgi:hypothetical protein
MDLESGVFFQIFFSFLIFFDCCNGVGQQMMNLPSDNGSVNKFRSQTVFCQQGLQAVRAISAHTY